MSTAELGRFDEAAKVYREWLEDEPDNPKALHHLAACTGQDVPTRASDAYVQYVFDSFSKSFDSKLAMLGYRAPTLVAEAVSECLGTAATGLTVLDAGCGTGLCAALLKPFAGRLTGIDLSEGMLAKARGRGLYDELHQAELTAYMQQHAAHYDVVVSADTLVYFGALDEAMRAAAHALRPGGYLCFTVEALAEGESGRLPVAASRQVCPFQGLPGSHVGAGGFWRPEVGSGGLALRGWGARHRLAGAGPKGRRIAQGAAHALRPQQGAEGRPPPSSRRFLPIPLAIEMIGPAIHRRGDATVRLPKRHCRVSFLPMGPCAPNQPSGSPHAMRLRDNDSSPGSSLAPLG